MHIHYFFILAVINQDSSIQLLRFCGVDKQLLEQLHEAELLETARGDVHFSAFWLSKPSFRARKALRLIFDILLKGSKTKATRH